MNMNNIVGFIILSSSQQDQLHRDMKYKPDYEILWGCSIDHTLVKSIATNM